MVGVAGDGTLRVGVPSIGKHILRVVVAGGGSHHAEAAEHRVGLPATDEFDGFGVDSSAEEGGSTARAEKRRRSVSKRSRASGAAVARGVLASRTG